MVWSVGGAYGVRLPLEEEGVRSCRREQRWVSSGFRGWDQDLMIGLWRQVLGLVLQVLWNIPDFPLYQSDSDVSVKYIYRDLPTKLENINYLPIQYIKDQRTIIPKKKTTNDFHNVRLSNSHHKKTSNFLD
eukprot:gene1670-3228_t